jgi:hypothetical protein
MQWVDTSDRQALVTALSDHTIVVFSCVKAELAARSLRLVSTKLTLPDTDRAVATCHGVLADEWTNGELIIF